jgi:hypothetical protein
VFSVVLNPSLGPHFSVANAFQNIPFFLPKNYSCIKIQHLTLYQQPKILHNKYIDFAKLTSTRCDGNGMLEVGFIYWVLGYLRRDEWLHCVWVNMNGTSQSFVWFNECCEKGISKHWCTIDHPTRVITVVSKECNWPSLLSFVHTCI